MKTKIMQQENPRGHGVQQHLERPGEEKTFCGRKYTENWGVIGEVDLVIEDVRQYIPCSVCLLAVEKFLRKRS